VETEEERHFERLLEKSLLSLLQDRQGQLENPRRLVVACAHKQLLLHKPTTGFHDIIEKVFNNIADELGWWVRGWVPRTTVLGSQTPAIALQLHTSQHPDEFGG
jgi:hypothetical protein